MKKLIDLLRDNARLSNSELAVMLGISESDVEAQIAGLEKDGVICGYKAIINGEKLGSCDVTALIEIKVTPKLGFGFDEIAHRIASFPEVDSVYLMSGGYDLALTIHGSTFQEVAMFVAKRLSPLDSVVSTATHFILRRYKDVGALLAQNGDDRGTVSL